MGKDHELIQAVKLEDVATVMRIVGKVKLKPKRSGSSKKSPLNFQDEDGFSALHHAALNGNCHILSLLLNSRQVNVDIKDNKGMRPLHYAAWQGKIEPVELLIRAGATPSDPSLGGVTPLHLASQYGSYNVVEALLQYKADPFLEQKEGKTPLDFAAEFGRLRVVELLLGTCQSLIHYEGQSRMRQRIHTPLHLAAKNGHSDVASVLLDHGMDVNLETHNGTSLHEAALAGKSEVVSLLINGGIDVLKKDSQGQTALDIVNKFTATRAASDIKTLLRDAIGGSQAKAIKDFMRLHDRAALSFKAGDIINVIERNPDGRWKGSLKKGNNECIGYFPRDHVQLIRGPPSSSDSNNYPGTTSSPSQPSFPIMPANTYPNNAPVSPLADRANRYSSGSTASASSSGNWSNRGSIGQTITTGMRPNHLPVTVIPDPPSGFPPPPPVNNGNFDEDLPPPPPEMLNHNRSPHGTIRYNNDLGHHPQPRGSPSHSSGHNNYSNTTSPKRLNYPIPPWLAGNKFSDESGVDLYSSNENIERRDADRIYDWLRQQRLAEYTNNFTLAGYDMPTIAKMTPEDLTAIGVTKPAHRKRITAMISKMKEPDPLPKYIPVDVVTWLRLLDLSQYYNTLISNDYGTMEKASEISWEDLQEIGINRLGDQKKFTLAIKRLNYLKKHSSNKLPSPSYPASLNSDSGSISPAQSLEGANQAFPPPAQFALPNRKISPHSPHQDESHLMVKRRSGGLRSSRESLASDVSIGSVGSQGSHEQYRQDANKRPNNQTINEGIESTYIPTLSSFRMPGQGTKKSTSLHSLDDSTSEGHLKGLSFSTFKQPQISPEEASRGYTGRSTESLDRLMAAQAMADRFKRNSVEGGSSIASSGSGSGEQPAVKLKKSLPPAPPKRTNSISSQSKDYEPKTATIGRKKSLKKFREEMQLHRTEMEAEFAAGGFDGQTDRIEGYATIKRSHKKIDPIQKLQRSQSQEGDVFRGITPSPILPSPVTMMPAGNTHGRGSQERVQQSGGYQQHPNIYPQFVQSNDSRSRNSNVTATRTDSNVSYPTGGQDQRYPQAIPHGPQYSPIVPPSSNTYHAPSNAHPSGNVEARYPSPQYAYSAVPSHNQVNSYIQTNQNGGHMDRMPSAGSDGAEHIYEVPQMSQTEISQSQKPIYQPPYARVSNTHSTTEPHSSARGGVPTYTDLPQNAVAANYQFVCPPDNKSALPGTQAPVVHTLKNRKSTHDQTRKVSMSEQSTSSNDSGGSIKKRPNSLEMKKHQGHVEDDATPILQPALANPLGNIWRPKSRHLVRTASADKGDSSSGSDKSDSGSEATQIKTDATFLQLKKQFLEQDSQNPPVPFSTLKRQGRKPEPLTGTSSLKTPGFSDQDEYNQSPVAKHPPYEFPDVRNGIMNPEQGSSLGSSSGAGDVKGPPSDPPKSPSTTQKSRRDDLQSRVEKIAAGRRDPSPTKPFSGFGPVPDNNSLQIQLSDIPPAPDFAAPVPNHISTSTVGGGMDDFPPPPPPLSAPQHIGGPPPPPPPPPPAMVKPKRTFNGSANNNNNQRILNPAGPKNKAPVKIMPDMADLQRELQRRTSKHGNGTSVEEAIKKNQSEQKREQTKTNITPPGTLKSRVKNPPTVVIPARKPTKPPAIKKKPVPPPPVKPKSPILKELPRDDEKDVDIFSQNLDAMELSANSEDVIESDNSDIETALSGFENENTDTIKKQPSKTSPPRPTLKLRKVEQQAAPISRPKVESPGVSWEDDDGMGTVRRRPKEEKKADPEPKRDSLGEAMEKLEALLNSPDIELMSDSANSTPEKKTEDRKPKPAVTEEKTEAEAMSAEEENKVFSDLESMFESLAMDLENMLL